MKLFSGSWDMGITKGLAIVISFAAMAAHAQVYTPLYNYGSNAGDPLQPSAFSAIAQGRDGRLYSTTAFGGANTSGAAYAITTSGNLSTLYAFAANPEDRAPFSGLTLGTDGFFYGSTTTGGTNGGGNVFKLSDTGVYTGLRDFTGGPDGTIPEAPLVQGADGNLYSTTDGTIHTVFKITPKGILTTLHTFKGTDGSIPFGMILGLDANFDGITRGGGAHNLG